VGGDGEHVNRGVCHVGKAISRAATAGSYS
jgi:hypothetical protein